MATKKRPALPARLETVEHQEFVAWCRCMAGRIPELGLIVAIPNGIWLPTKNPKTRAQIIARMKREGLATGYPDLLLDVARGDFHGWRCEMKRTDAAPSDVSPEQREWHARLTAQGYCVVVARGWEQARDAVLAYLALPKPATVRAA